MSRSVLLVFLSAVLLLHSLATAQSPQTVADVQISSVSGCVDVYPVTVNCSVATTTLLIETVAGFPAGMDLSHSSINVDAHVGGGYTYFLTTTAWANPSDTTHSSVFVNITAGAYYPHLTDVLISLSFVDYYSIGGPYTSAAFAGFSYRFEGPPTLLSIGGCDGSGASTLNCVPDSSTIELRGSGFLWYAGKGTGSGVHLTIGAETTLAPIRSGNLQFINDTYAILWLRGIYGQLLRPQHYAGVLLPISFTSSALSRTGQPELSYSTNSLTISFVPLPPPNITQWFIRDCNESALNLATYTNCVPGVSGVSLVGNYMYDAQVTVGGAICSRPTKSSGQPQSHYCYLPNFAFDPSIPYDLVVSNDAGNATLRSLVRYARTPMLISIDQCIDRGELYAQSQYYGVQCPIGTSITLRGSRFPAADAIAVQFVPYYTPQPIIVPLLNATLINSSTLSVTLPALDNETIAAAVYGAYGTVQALFTSSGVTMATNAINNRLYILPNAPSITSVNSTMCDTISPLQLTNCRATATITVVGSNLFSELDQQTRLLLSTSTAGGDFLGWNYLLPSNYSIIYNPFANTSFVLTLDYYDADINSHLQPNVVYTLFINSNDGYYWAQSNAFRLSLTYGAADVVTISADSGLSSGAVVGIVVAALLVGVLLVLVGVRLVRWLLSSASPLWPSFAAVEDLQRSMRSDAHSSGDEYRNVELN